MGFSGSAPTLTVQPEGPHLVEPFRPLEVVCIGAGSPPPDVYLTLNGERLEKPEGAELSVVKLRIPHVTKSETYTCTAANIYGSLSVEVEVTVKGEFNNQTYIYLG